MTATLTIPACPLCATSAEERIEGVRVGNNPAWPVVEQRFWCCPDCHETWLDREQAQAYFAEARLAGFVYFRDDITNANQLSWAHEEIARLETIRVPDTLDRRRLDYLRDAMKRYQEAA
jgi:hypothetical protein